MGNGGAVTNRGRGRWHVTTQYVDPMTESGANGAMAASPPRERPKRSCGRPRRPGQRRLGGAVEDDGAGVPERPLATES